MGLSVGRVNYVNFAGANNTTDKKALPPKKENENPISLNGERAKLVTGTFAVGLGFGIKALAELIDGDFLVDELFDAGEKVAVKNFKNSSPAKQCMAALGAAIGITGLFVAGVAAIYTIYNAPKINYDSKVNTFTKTKDMDVYIKGNEIEKDLYTEINEKAKTATKEEKKHLKEQYALLKMAKNEVPAFARF
ncbi:MAG: hypothetical protein Q4F80_04680 [bacterium]|nr:hypothetical protein [bacterium]